MRTVLYPIPVSNYIESSIVLCWSLLAIFEDKCLRCIQPAPSGTHESLDSDSTCGAPPVVTILDDNGMCLLCLMLLSSTHEHIGLTGTRCRRDTVPANNNTLLKDINVQDVSTVVGVWHEDKSRDVGALFGKPYMQKARDGKIHMYRDCEACK
jgi:hypothetical protein